MINNWNLYIIWGSFPAHHKPFTIKLVRTFWGVFSDKVLQIPIREFQLYFNTADTKPISYNCPHYIPYETNYISILFQKINYRGVETWKQYHWVPSFITGGTSTINYACNTVILSMSPDHSPSHSVDEVTPSYTLLKRDAKLTQTCSLNIEIYRPDPNHRQILPSSYPIKFSIGKIFLWYNIIHYLYLHRLWLYVNNIGTNRPYSKSPQCNDMLQSISWMTLPNSHRSWKKSFSTLSASSKWSIIKEGPSS